MDIRLQKMQKKCAAGNQFIVTNHHPATDGGKFFSCEQSFFHQLHPSTFTSEIKQINKEQSDCKFLPLFFLSLKKFQSWQL